LGLAGASLAGCLGGGDNGNAAGDSSRDSEGVPDALTFAGGGEGGAWSLGATVWGEFAGQTFSDVSTTSRDGGGESNIIDVAGGDVDIAWTFSNTLYTGYNGEGNFPRKFDELRAIAAVWPAPAMAVADPQYETFADLAGASIAPGEVGLSGYAAALMLLDYHGVSENEVDIVASGYGEMPSLYHDQTVDSVHVMGSLPHSVISQALSQRDGRLLPVSDSVRNQIMDERPGWTEIPIPANMFPEAENGDRDVMTAGTYTVIFTRKNMSEEVIYELTKKNFQDKQQMVDAHSVYDQMSIETVTQGIDGFPLHPGAERALEEMGANV